MTLPSHSITTRISVLFSCLAVLVLSVMGYVIMASVTHHFEEQDQMALQGKLALVQNIINETSGAETYHLIQAKLADALVGHHELTLKMLDEDGAVVFATPHANFADTLFAQSVNFDSRQPLALIALDVQHHQYRATSVTLSSMPGGRRYQVVIAVDIGHHQVFLDSFGWQLATVGCSGLALMVVLGWVATRHGLQPVHDMATVAEGITAQKIKERLPTEYLPAELRSLSASFNNMLNRLEDALARLSDFSSDIAHELRTPLNNLMTQTQVSLAKERTAEEYRDVLFSNMEEYERLARMIGDMLFLAKADNGQIVPHAETIFLADEVHALFDFYDALAAEKQVNLACTGVADVMGDRLMLRRALSNLMSNAIRHASPGSTIHVTLKAIQDKVEIKIINQGDTLTPDLLSRIFERFYRADASRYRVDEGAGLGLAITRSIVLAHRGEITATSEAGVTCFHVALPCNTERGL